TDFYLSLFHFQSSQNYFRGCFLSISNVTLTCRAPSNNIIVVEWSRADLGKECVLMYRDELFVPDEQHPSFKNRVDLQDRQMKDGDVSLILKNVMISDTGTYECRIFRKTNPSRSFLVLLLLLLGVNLELIL
uniref:Ig-like domain-containing protein n=1 Tax=Oreochromis niloticus TaxID=8128 RepID=I3JMF4_ORENI